jgi:hypothetical protein
MAESEVEANFPAFRRYQQSVSLLILDFQWIEELLKVVISASYESIRLSNPVGVSLKLNRASLEKDSLGKLIQKYSELSVNCQLIIELRDIAQERNNAIHQSFVLSLEESVDVDFFDSKALQMNQLKIKTRKCLASLKAELEAFAKSFDESSISIARREV